MVRDIEMLCFVVDRHCIAVHPCPCVFLYVEPTMRQEHGMCSVMGHCVSIYTFMHQPLQISQLLITIMRHHTLAASFAVCWSTILIHPSVWYIVPHVLDDKGCKCKVGCCPKLSCCFLCFLERERERGGERERERPYTLYALECWKLLP